ncbi:MAG TPA: hypothetical protein K8V08_09980 [Brevibacterium senegalense]|uniref:Uncharacterized protein n=1 Tax=Brevibacterium senegalense TaxID=1033736 RepID=A0A921SNS3_9MICO|nr:hypothetical protein [Brevibacterium senegalense]
MADTRDPHHLDPAGAGDPAEEPTAVLGDGPDEDVQVVPASKPRGDDGFGLGYRFFFRFQYTLLHVIGPPRLTASMDPRTRLKADYERRKALHQQWKASRG